MDERARLTQGKQRRRERFNVDVVNYGKDQVVTDHFDMRCIRLGGVDQDDVQPARIALNLITGQNREGVTGRRHETVFKIEHDLSAQVRLARNLQSPITASFCASADWYFHYPGLRLLEIAID